MLSSKPREAKSYRTENNRSPFEDWLSKLKDVVGKAKIFARIERAEKGTFGKYRDLGSGLFELKEAFGPGYRIYFGLERDELIILLIGGDKRTQTKDIAKARELWSEYRGFRE